MKKVAGYCRVSTDREDQANSFAAQKRYFEEYINRREDWELYLIYADEGISGTSIKRREQFCRMISDAEGGEFELIITKEVSRFSRNILDTISYTRKLKAIGVGVIFMNDGINTLEADAELRLSIMASVAQEESRKTSSRVKWGQMRQMERGVVFGRSMLGYDVKNGKMTIEPEGAETVRLIFQKYGVEKKGTSVIAKELEEAGYHTSSGSQVWSASHIIKILKNEKYVGDLVQKKTCTPDYLTHEKKYNHGIEELVVIRDHHEAIIGRELWNTVQKELEDRRKSKAGANHISVSYAFSGKIRCGECGSSFISHTEKRADGTSCRKWRCGRAAKEGKKHTDIYGNEKGCSIGRMLRDEAAYEMLMTALASLELDFDNIADNIALVVCDAMESGRSHDTEKLKTEIKRTEKKKEDALDAFFDGNITKEEYGSICARYACRLSELREKLKTAEEREKSCQSEDMTDELRRTVKAVLSGETVSEILCRTIVERISVYRDHAEMKLKFLPQVFSFDI